MQAAKVITAVLLLLLLVVVVVVSSMYTAVVARTVPGAGPIARPIWLGGNCTHSKIWLRCPFTQVWSWLVCCSQEFLDFTKGRAVIFFGGVIVVL